MNHRARREGRKEIDSLEPRDQNDVFSFVIHWKLMSWPTASTRTKLACLSFSAQNVTLKDVGRWTFDVGRWKRWTTWPGWMAVTWWDKWRRFECASWCLRRVFVAKSTFAVAVWERLHLHQFSGYRKINDTSRRTASRATFQYQYRPLYSSRA